MQSNAIGGDVAYPVKTSVQEVAQGRNFFQKRAEDFGELCVTVKALVGDAHVAYERFSQRLESCGEMIGGKLDQFAVRYPYLAMITGVGLICAGLYPYAVLLPLGLEFIITSAIAFPLAAPVIILGGVAVMLAAQAGVHALMKAGARAAADGLVQAQSEFRMASEGRASHKKLEQLVATNRILSVEEKNEVRKEWKSLRRERGEKIAHFEDKMQEVVLRKLAEHFLLGEKSVLDATEKEEIKREWKNMSLDLQDVHKFATDLNAVYKQHLQAHEKGANALENLVAGSVGYISSV